MLSRQQSRSTKKAYERYQSLSKEEKERNNYMVVKDTKSLRR